MKFSDYLDWCSARVATWPKWKQRVIGKDSITAQKGSYIETRPKPDPEEGKE
jgi:hypothetical protein